MGQTLTHGVYLPDEGERNCYSGLAANWQILDNSVGTIAAHTSALAGKAPLVHTHTVSQITDFPAYGNTAGTICEGNDSRLSDARTPVAHTHTKSDVTDLLNSNFIPSANNSYDLGSSSYQWNNLYANNYYYNGVAWGLDKSNVWSNQQIYSYYSTSYKSTGYEIGIAPSSNQVQFIDFIDKNNNRIGWIRRGNITDGTSRLDIEIFNRFSNGSLSPTGTELGAGFSIEFNSTGGASVRPVRPNAINLGTSTNKWKSLNGINPGALSLPDLSSGTGVSLSAGANSYSPPSSGWLSINLTGTISVVCGNFCHSGTDMLSVPVVKGSTYTVTVATSGTAYLFVSQGNV